MRAHEHLDSLNLFWVLASFPEEKLLIQPPGAALPPEPPDEAMPLDHVGGCGPPNPCLHTFLPLWAPLDCFCSFATLIAHDHGMTPYTIDNLTSCIIADSLEFLEFAQYGVVGRTPEVSLTCIPWWDRVSTTTRLPHMPIEGLVTSLKILPRESRRFPCM